MKTLLKRLTGALWMAVNRKRYRKHWHWWQQTAYDCTMLAPLEGFIRNSGVSKRDAELDRDVGQKIRQFWKFQVGEAARLEYYQILKVALKKTPDVHYIPDDVWYYILPFLNPLDESRVLEDKSKYAFYFHDVNRPLEVVRKIRGTYYDQQNLIVSEQRAIDAVMRYGRPVFVKPTIDSMQGNKVHFLSSYSKEELKLMFKKYGNDFTIQEQVRQSPEMARFNASSLNSFRLTTLFLNGRFSVLSSIIRVGKLGACVDNVGAGGYAVGVRADGSVNETGYNAKGEFITKTYAGIPLMGMRIEGFSNIVSFVKGMHERLPYIPFVG